ncbi:unnamed protein product [Closterium sp. NIES-65]|nr:unnamed protein product [Closterium sp. NIES-65]
MNPSRPGGYGARSGRYGGAAGTPAGAGKGPGGPSSRSNAALQAQQRLRALMSNTSDESQDDYSSQVRALSACARGSSGGGMRQPPTGGAMGRTRPAGGGYDAPDPMGDPYRGGGRHGRIRHGTTPSSAPRFTPLHRPRRSGRDTVASRQEMESIKRESAKLKDDVRAAYLLSQATMASTPTATTSRTPPSESPGSSAGGTSSSTSLVCMDSKHAVYRHFKVPANSVGENGTKVCAYCNFTFVGGVHRRAQHITSWNGMRRREVHLCTAAPKTARDAVKALYESKLKAREAKRAAEIAAVGAVNGRGSDKKKSRMTDFYGDDAACANQAADEAISLFFAALHVPEHHADHPLWRNVVSSIQRAGPNYVAPKRRYIGGAGLAKCRQRIEAALAPISASWHRDGVTVASDMFSDKTGRPQANVLLINDSGAVFVESIDTNMEMKTGGYIAGTLRPIIEKVGPENVVALCFDGGSNYAAACRVLMREYPHIEHIPCATHVLDLLMEDIGKKGWAKDITTRGDTLISFVRNHHFTRGYMRSPLVNGGKGKQVLKPAGTRFGTNYIAINRLCEVRAGLTQMVLSDEWVEWTAAADRAGADTFKDNILDAAWWTRAEFFAKLMRLPFVVMRKTDSDSKGMMGRLYDLMLQLTEDIRDFLDEHAEGVLTSDEVGDIREIVQDRWDNGLACNLHVIGRILYPTNQEECIFRTDLECTRVFKQYVSKHHGDKTVIRKDGVERRASLVIQEGLNAFLNLQRSFGMPDAIADR